MITRNILGHYTVEHKQISKDENRDLSRFIYQRATVLILSKLTHRTLLLQMIPERESSCLVATELRANALEEHAHLVLPRRRRLVPEVRASQTHANAPEVVGGASLVDWATRLAEFLHAVRILLELGH